MSLDLADDKSALVKWWLGAVNQQTIAWANFDQEILTIDLFHNNFSPSG